jgi:hypothetical protein
MHVQIPVIPVGLEEALKDVEGALTTIEAMPLEYRRRAFRFIERAGNAPTRDFRIRNFVEVVRFFQQDAGK